jgi:hypothetical protein
MTRLVRSAIGFVLALSCVASLTHATTISFSDTWNRTTLNVAATKSAGNPEIGSDYADPFFYFEGSTYYVFAVDQANKNIVYFTSSDKATWSGATVILNKGGASAWDEYSVRDPFVIKVGTTYYLFYSGQQDSGGGATTHKLGYATASSLTGTYTKYASNPIITVASNGTNEPSVDYDNTRTPAWQLFATVGSGGSKEDVGDGDIKRFTANSPDGTWTDQGVVLASPYQDQQQTTDGGIMVMQLNSGPAIVQSVSKDGGATWVAPISGNILTKSGSGFETSAIYAPSMIQEGDGTWSIFYQGVNVADSQLGYATIPRLNRWVLSAADAFNMPSDHLHSTTPSPLAWNSAMSEYWFSPAGNGYTLTCESQAESQSDSGIYTHGIVVAKSASLYYMVMINEAGTKLSLYSGADPRSTTTNLGDNTSLTMGTGTYHTVRATVTPTSITIDWHNGTSWETGALSATGLTLVASQVGVNAYAPANNLSRFRNFTVNSIATTGIHRQRMMRGVG